ncbi:hypothetical protein BDD12DRAFT_910343 [Trichophaea hybrida]|nr:hypothetical protein BDD12DRAFT_910343 [Trichophaea hybrida]
MCLGLWLAISSQSIDSPRVGSTGYEPLRNHGLGTIFNYRADKTSNRNEPIFERGHVVPDASGTHPRSQRFVLEDTTILHRQRKRYENAARFQSDVQRPPARDSHETETETETDTDGDQDGYRWRPRRRLMRRPRWRLIQRPTETDTETETETKTDSDGGQDGYRWRPRQRLIRRPRRRLIRRPAETDTETDANTRRPRQIPMETKTETETDTKETKMDTDGDRDGDLYADQDGD